MKQETSLYLDTVRFVSALVVFLGHAAGKLTGGFLWQLNGYLSAAVMVFFVLSGYVIAFVYDRKENNIKSYAISRISRFYSVVIPALLLTFICDYLGIYINYDLYFDGPWPAPQSDLANYLLSLFFIQNIWGLNLNPGMNGPFWSLTFEVGFYFLFASFVFFKGWRRVTFIILASLLFGPDVITYLPIWLLGCLVYFLHKRIENANIILSLFFFTTSLSALLFLTPYLYSSINATPGFVLTSRNVYADYIVASIFAVNLLFSNYTSMITVVLFRFKIIITFLASCTFSLYLFHRPLIQLLAAIEIGSPSSIINRLFVIGGTLLIVYTLGRWCESQRFFIKKMLYSLWNFRKQRK